MSSRAIPNRLMLLAITVTLGCGASGQPADSPEPEQPELPPAPALPDLPPGHVWRMQVMEVMSPGAGAFLQRLDVRESLVNRKFHGWRIVKFVGDPSFWEGVELKPGDVVTEVNGTPLGHYDDAYGVWQSLVTAPEIVISYERGGEKREIRYVIHDEEVDGGVGTPAAAADSGPPPK